ncbi:hypothetical protein KOR42_50630 [Thalassoglobus neptunius]|uniref:Uncharacterized protein n=1 Tax=Thalassoglobus neptunius TaxID=1938619 RepID=A0A5C5VP64_9PLAN|nr:hypothetical protein KOR42_50630 [Thalassoglobus neptunius]
MKDCRWYDTANSVDLDRYEYGYDRVGNRLYRKNVLAHAASKEYDYLYTYDGLNRLKEMERGLLNGTNTAMSTYKFGQCWELDETGNWSQFRQDLYGNGGWSFNQQRTNNTVNEITDIAETAGPSWATPAYDVKGNMTTLPQPDDPTGTYSATYDAWNRLVKLQDGATTVQENEYDGLNRRTIRKTYTSGTLSEKRFYFYTEDWQCIEERVADGSTTPGLLPAKEQHVWGNRYIDECVLRDRDYNNNGTTLEERLYATQDANWNTTMLYKQSSGYKERYTYNPYGEITFLNSSFNPVGGSVHNWQHLFGSYKRDTTTELYLVRNRFYHTGLGTWLSRDPVGYTSSLSLYEFVDSGPLTFFDPTGLEPAGYNHPYPLYLGGQNDQPLFYLKEPEHTKFHDYFREIFSNAGIKNTRGYGQSTRDYWKKLTETQQHQHIKNAMTRAGISAADINKYFDDIIKGASPGTCIIRRTGKGPKIGSPKPLKPPGPFRRGASAIGRATKGILVFIGVISAASDFAEGAQGKGKHDGATGVLPGLGNAAHRSVYGPEIEAGFEMGIKKAGESLGLDGEGQTPCRRGMSSGVDVKSILDDINR